MLIFMLLYFLLHTHTKYKCFSQKHNGVEGFGRTHVTLRAFNLRCGIMVDSGLLFLFYIL